MIDLFETKRGNYFQFSSKGLIISNIFVNMINIRIMVEGKMSV